MHLFECPALKKFRFSEKRNWRTDALSGILWAGLRIKYVAFHPGGGLTMRQITDACGGQGGGQIMSACTHLSHIHKVTPHTKGCQECLKMGDTWVHLRLCMECGHVGCCDSSKNKHATKHFHRSKHPIMRSLEPGENWGWCFVDELELDFS
jgi:hypothetical protein